MNANVCRVYESSKVAEGQKRMLLIFLFLASSTELRSVRMCPECCKCDTTFGTNKSKKELFTLAFKDGKNNKAFNGGRAFIPCAQTWVFNLLFKVCLLQFWGQTTTCERVHLMLTDGCVQEYLPLINSTGTNKSFPNAIHGLCYFHLVKKTHGMQT